MRLLPGHPRALGQTEGGLLGRRSAALSVIPDAQLPSPLNACLIVPRNSNGPEICSLGGAANSPRADGSLDCFWGPNIERSCIDSPAASLALTRIPSARCAGRPTLWAACTSYRLHPLGEQRIRVPDENAHCHLLRDHVAGAAVAVAPGSANGYVSRFEQGISRPDPQFFGRRVHVGLTRATLSGLLIVAQSLRDCT